MKRVLVGCDFKVMNKHDMIQTKIKNRVRKNLFSRTGVNIDLKHMVHIDQVFYIRTDDNVQRLQHEHTRISNKNTVHIMVGVVDYVESDRDRNHAISAFRHNGVLYCYNSHGNSAEPIDNLIWKDLATRYNCAHYVAYTGPNMQSTNRMGVCVGLSTNFGTLMYSDLIYRDFPTHLIYDSFIFDKYVNYLFHTYEGVFGEYSQNALKVYKNLKHNIKQNPNKPSNGNKRKQRLNKMNYTLEKRKRVVNKSSATPMNINSMNVDTMNID